MTRLLCCTVLAALCCPNAVLQLRKPLDVWSFVKSPYGLMIGFMLFGIFVFPMLKVDQEEYREAMASLRGEGPPVQTAAAARLRDR
jgi:ER membrane protein complex subunit 7